MDKQELERKVAHLVRTKYKHPEHVAKQIIPIIQADTEARYIKAMVDEGNDAYKRGYAKALIDKPPAPVLSDETCSLCHNAGWVIEAKERGNEVTMEIIPCLIPDCLYSGKRVELTSIDYLKMTNATIHPKDGFIMSVSRRDSDHKYYTGGD